MANRKSTRPSFNDLKLAGEVRNLTLKEMMRVLKGTDEVYKKELVLRLAANTLPRLNEHTGQDGDEIKVKGVEISFS